MFRRRIVFPLEEVSVIFGFFIFFYVSLLLEQLFEFSYKHRNGFRVQGTITQCYNQCLDYDYRENTANVPKRFSAQILSA
jgi:hypothetical protein